MSVIWRALSGRLDESRRDDVSAVDPRAYEVDIFHNALLKSIGDEHGKSIAQVVLRWLTQRGIVAIPKFVRKERMAENFDVFDFELSAAEMSSPSPRSTPARAASSITATRRW
jgi:diketogulonate reductase-like aldo/keto reductase